MYLGQDLPGRLSAKSIRSGRFVKLIVKGQAKIALLYTV